MNNELISYLGSMISKTLCMNNELFSCLCLMISKTLCMKNEQFAVRSCLCSMIPRVVLNTHWGLLQQIKNGI